MAAQIDPDHLVSLIDPGNSPVRRFKRFRFPFVQFFRQRLARGVHLRQFVGQRSDFLLLFLLRRRGLFAEGVKLAAQRLLFAGDAVHILDVRYSPIVEILLGDHKLVPHLFPEHLLFVADLFDFGHQFVDPVRRIDDLGVLVPQHGQQMRGQRTVIALFLRDRCLEGQHVLLVVGLHFSNLLVFRVPNPCLKVIVFLDHLVPAVGDPLQIGGGVVRFSWIASCDFL